MKKLFWNLFLKSGSVDAFLGFKEFEAAEKKKDCDGAAVETYGEFGYEQ